MTKSEIDLSTLCVPMKVQAMMVGQSPSPTIFADIPDNFTNIVFNPLGDLVPSGIMNTKATEKPGVHLHWILPAGLRQGLQQKEDEKPEYPRVPDRWIISRL